MTLFFGFSISFDMCLPCAVITIKEKEVKKHFIVVTTFLCVVYNTRVFLWKDIRCLSSRIYSFWDEQSQMGHHLGLLAITPAITQAVLTYEEMPFTGILVTMNIPQVLRNRCITASAHWTLLFLGYGTT